MRRAKGRALSLLQVLEQGGIIALVTILNCIMGMGGGPIARIWTDFEIPAEVDFGGHPAVLAVVDMSE